METSEKECIFTLTLVARCEITTFIAKFWNNWEKGGPNNSGRFLRMYMTSSEKPGKRAAGLQPVIFPSSSPHLSRGCCLCLSVLVWNGQNGSDCDQPVHHSTVVRRGAPQSAWWEDLSTCCSRYTTDYVSFWASTPTRSSICTCPRTTTWTCTSACICPRSSTWICPRTSTKSSIRNCPKTCTCSCPSPAKSGPVPAESP